MKISREDVLKVAALANLELSDEEVDTYRSHLDDILGQEGISFEQPALRLLAQGAHGSMRWSVRKPRPVFSTS